ncbi:MAG: hypothetical protein ACLFS9_05690 [Nitriliruptoraceae bacterium]
MPQHVDPLDTDVGEAAGHRVRLLSLERFEGWADLRFIRFDAGHGQRLPRRVPPPEAWSVTCDRAEVRVHDAVGRGDRWFSNGEVRLVPAPPAGSRLTVEVVLADGAPTLRTELTLPS